MRELVFWEGKGELENGRIYRSHGEWYERCGITRSRLDMATRLLEERGVLEVGWAIRPKDSRRVRAYGINLWALAEIVAPAELACIEPELAHLAPPGTEDESNRSQQTLNSQSQPSRFSCKTQENGGATESTSERTTKRSTKTPPKPPSEESKRAKPVSDPAPSESASSPTAPATSGKNGVPDYRRMVSDFVADDPLGPGVRKFIKRVRERDGSCAGGRLDWLRQYEQFVAPVLAARERGEKPEAVRYALAEANRRAAKNMSYFEAVLRNNPDGDPAKKGGANGRTTRPSGGQRGALPGEPDGDGGGSVRDGYEWLFAN